MAFVEKKDILVLFSKFQGQTLTILKNAYQYQNAYKKVYKNDQCYIFF